VDLNKGRSSRWSFISDIVVFFLLLEAQVTLTMANGCVKALRGGQGAQRKQQHWAPLFLHRVQAVAGVLYKAFALFQAARTAAGLSAILGEISQ
jgi:hypothetical protein